MVEKRLVEEEMAEVGYSALECYRELLESPAIASDVEELLKSPAVLPALRRRLENPEKWAAYRNMSLEKVAEVAIGAGYDSPEVIALGYKTLKTVAELSEEQAQELIAALGG